jgi:hypothetical protein
MVQAVAPGDVESALLLCVVGFLVGVLGHVFQSKTIVASGILMIVVAVIVIPILLYEE